MVDPKTRKDGNRKKWKKEREREREGVCVWERDKNSWSDFKDILSLEFDHVAREWQIFLG